MAAEKKKRKTLRPRRTNSERRTSRRNIIRKSLSIFLLLLCWIPMLGGGVQPLWTIPAAVCISMNEDMYFCMAAGVIAGFGIDIACGSALGANAIYMVCFCTFVCLLFEQILRRGFLHFFWLTAVGVFGRNLLSWLLSVGIFRTAGHEQVWQRVLLPSALWTLAAAIPVYLLFLPCAGILTKQVRSMNAAAIRRDL